VERVALRLSNVMDGATADDIPAVFAWEWACCSPLYLGERDSHFHHEDARTERRVLEALGILVSATQVESTRFHASARPDSCLPTPTSQSALEVRGFSIANGTCRKYHGRGNHMPKSLC